MAVFHLFNDIHCTPKDGEKDTSLKLDIYSKEMRANLEAYRQMVGDAAGQGSINANNVNNSEVDKNTNDK